MTKQQNNFRLVNNVLNGVLNTALAYWIHHDVEFKKYCLQTATWGAVDKLRKLTTKLAEPFVTPVQECIETCEKASQKMPEININYPEYSVAAESFAKLAGEMDKLVKANPSLKIGIADERNLASAVIFANLVRLITRAEEKTLVSH
jgi:hypothetical protein